MSTITSILPPIDAWTASSLLQKAIRRGERDYAQAAALVLFRLRGAAIWRRLILIAHEDVGVGDLELCTHVTICGTEKNERRRIGTDNEVLLDLVDRLAQAPKNRESDYLICSAKQAPFTETLRAAVATKSIAERGLIAVDPNRPIVERAMAVWMASGINGGGPQILSAGDLRSMIRAFNEVGLPNSFAATLEAACYATREPIVTMVPLLWAAINQSARAPVIVEDAMPISLMCDGLPSYTFDKHTHVGKRAVRQLLRENSTVRECLANFVPEYRSLDIALMGAFYADAIPVQRRASWHQSDELYTLGLRTDMTKIGVPEDGVLPIADILRASLDHLNDIRLRLRRNRNAASKPSHSNMRTRG